LVYYLRKHGVYTYFSSRVPLSYALGRASFKHGGGVITSSLTNAM
jgi:hypothetical protein